MDENEFRRMMGRDPKLAEDPEEAEARKERLESGEPTLGDIFSDEGFDVVEANMEERKGMVLEHFGLNDAPEHEAETGPDYGDYYDMLSKEQRKEYDKAHSTYLKRRFPTRDLEGGADSLIAFAATNPPEVLRRHTWRLQRGLDEPMFGAELPKRKRNTIRNYQAALILQLCDGCDDELTEQTMASGAEVSRHVRQADPWDRSQFQADISDPVYVYFFRYGDMFIEREKWGSLFGDDRFPYAPPKTCHRCGFSELDEWREAFGERD